MDGRQLLIVAGVALLAVALVTVAPFLAMAWMMSTVPIGGMEMNAPEGMNGMMGTGSMMGMGAMTGMGGMMGMGVWPTLLTVLLVAAMAFLAAWLVARPPRPATVDRDAASPLAILQQRYARGEISREEYERVRADLARVGT